jgi:hypothetical protein
MGRIAFPKTGSSHHHSWREKPFNLALMAGISVN